MKRKIRIYGGYLEAFMFPNCIIQAMTGTLDVKFLMEWFDSKAFGLKKDSRIKAFVFKFFSVPA